ncbi:MAG: hypothetical protein ACO201_01015, partial [Rickettsiales bacterium]
FEVSFIRIFLKIKVMRYLIKLLIIFLNISRDRLLIYWQNLSNLIFPFAFMEGLKANLGGI